MKYKSHLIFGGDLIATAVEGILIRVSQYLSVYIYLKSARERGQVDEYLDIDVIHGRNLVMAP